MVVAAGIDAAGDVDVQPADQVRRVVIGEAARDLLRDRDRARVRQRAVVQARTGDDVGHEVDVGDREANGLERLPHRRQVALADVRQRQVLLMPDPDLAERVFVGDVGQRIHLVGGRIARRLAYGLQRHGHDGIALHLVREDRVLAPCLELRIVRRLLQLLRHVRQRLVGRIEEARADVLDDPLIELEHAVADLLPLLLDLAAELLGAELVHQDLDARLVDVVAAAILIVGAQDRLDIAEQIALGQERLDGLGDERGAAKPAAHHHLEAHLAGAVLVHAQPDVMHLHRRTIVARGRERDLELARQEREFRMQGQMLAQQLGPQARILDLVGRDARPLIGGDVAHAIAAGLHAVQAGTREVRHRIGQLLELDPVELDVLPRGEVAVIAIVLARDVRKRPHLRR